MQFFSLQRDFLGFSFPKCADGRLFYSFTTLRTHLRPSLSTACNWGDAADGRDVPWRVSTGWLQAENATMHDRNAVGNHRFMPAKLQKNHLWRPMGIPFSCLHLYDPAAPALPVLLHHDVVHPSGMAFQLDHLGVTLLLNELTLGIVDFHGEVAIALKLDGDLVGGGVGMHDQGGTALLVVAVQMWRQGDVVDPSTVGAAADGVILGV